MSEASFNVARRLAQYAGEMPDAPAVVMTRRRIVPLGKRRYASATFAELEADSSLIARGLRAYGVGPGMRIALLVKPSIDFVTLVFALLKSGATSILIDPGMGRKNLLKCLADAEPEGFVAIPAAQAVRYAVRKRFPLAKLNVTVGRKLFWDGVTLEAIRALGANVDASDDVEARDGACVVRAAQDPAAIIFTTGSTGPPKGVLYSHGNFDRQVEEIRDGYGIRPGEVNVACFPLFGLFNAAMGVTTVIPRMDASRPAKVNPRNIVNAVNDWQATQSFASPAVWDKVGQYCTTRGIKLPTLREAYSAGAPVPPKVIERMTACLAAGGRMHTPYGATEALPVSTIASPEILGSSKVGGTARAWAVGRGTCVGRAFPGIERRVIRIVDGPISGIVVTEQLPTGEIGELLVRGPVVTASYATRTEANALAKVPDGETFWHRMGDTGYLDAEGRFWFCGRVAHRVRTATGTRYTDPCEGVFNQHSSVLRSALVGVGPIGDERPVVVVELVKARTVRTSRLEAELREMARKNPVTFGIVNFLFHPAMPVDIRHNSKIFREKLAVWAAEKLGVAPRSEA